MVRPTPYPQSAMKPSISVVMPTFNGERYIREALDSALSQTLPVSEIIVIDDGSSDGTAELLREYGDRIVYVRQPNQGVSSAYNAGIDLAKAEYIAFLEHDDVWLPNKCDLQATFLEQNPDHGLVFTAVELLIEGDASKVNFDVMDCEERDYTFDDFFLRNCILNCSSVMVRASVLRAVGELRVDMPLSFDYDLWLRVSARSKMHCLAQKLTQYRIHAHNLSRDAHDLAAAECSLRALSSWSGDSKVVTHLKVEQRHARLARLHRDAAWLCSQLGARGKELHHLWSAVLLQPQHSERWRDLLWAAIGQPMRKRLVWYARKLGVHLKT